MLNFKRIKIKNSTLKRCNQVGEINSPTVVKMALSKLPSVWKDAWGEKVIGNRQDMSLDSLRGWLDRKLTGREMSGFTQVEDGLDSDARGREGPRRIYSNATSSASGACVICRGEHQSRDCPTFRKGDLKRRTELVKDHRVFGLFGSGPRNQKLPVQESLWN